MCSVLDWRELRIQRGEDDALAEVRGGLWRNVMAYSSWELLAKSVLWDGKAAYSSIHPAFDKWLDLRNLLQPPHVSRAEAPQALGDCLQADAGRERFLPTFLGLNRSLISFPSWLVHEADALSEKRVLASMRHIVISQLTVPTLPPKQSSGSCKVSIRRRQSV